jgi:hypothetical protein
MIGLNNRLKLSIYKYNKNNENEYDKSNEKE